jgi:hypothetical protein
MNSSLLSAMLALAATMLGLSILVQIVQEVYKYLFSSKEKSYTNALIDFLGPWASQILEPGRVMKLQIRGPMQWFRFRPKQRLLPMERGELVSALELTAPTWVRQALERLKMEVDFQKDKTSAASPSPSPNWENLLTDLGNVEKGSPGYWSASQIKDFLLNHGHLIPGAHPLPDSEQGRPEKLGKVEFSKTQTWIASEILKAFQHQFLPHIVRAGDHFAQLQRNFEYQYERRNLRQTFIIALVMALLFNLSLQRLYQHATAVSPDEAVSLAETNLKLYQQYQETVQTSSLNGKGASAPLDAAQLKKLLGLSREILEQSKGIEFRFVGLDAFGNAKTIGRYILGCLVTALLLSFGAPFWNDATSALLNIQKAKKKESSPSLGEVSNG